MGFKKPHSFNSENVQAPSAFVAAAPVEAKPIPDSLRGGGAAPKAKKGAAKTREGFKRETLIFPLTLSKTIKELAAEEFKDFSNMTRDLVVEALRARGRLISK